MGKSQGNSKAQNPKACCSDLRIRMIRKEWNEYGAMACYFFSFFFLLCKTRIAVRSPVLFLTPYQTLWSQRLRTHGLMQNDKAHSRLQTQDIANWWVRHFHSAHSINSRVIYKAPTSSAPCSRSDNKSTLLHPEDCRSPIRESEITFHLPERMFSACHTEAKQNSSAQRGAWGQAARMLSLHLCG